MQDCLLLPEHFPVVVSALLAGARWHYDVIGTYIRLVFRTSKRLRDLILVEKRYRWLRTQSDLREAFYRERFREAAAATAVAFRGKPSNEVYAKWADGLTGVLNPTHDCHWFYDRMDKSSISTAGAAATVLPAMSDWLKKQLPRTRVVYTKFHERVTMTLRVSFYAPPEPTEDEEPTYRFQIEFI